MTKDQINAKKAELLDAYIYELKDRVSFGCFLDSEELDLMKKYNKLPTTKTFTEDPYVDEIAGKRLYNLIQDCYYALNGNWKRDIRVSEIPTLEEMKDNCRNFGKLTQKEFNELKKKYEKL